MAHFFQWINKWLYDIIGVYSCIKLLVVSLFAIILLFKFISGIYSLNFLLGILEWYQSLGSACGFFNFQLKLLSKGFAEEVKNPVPAAK